MRASGDIITHPDKYRQLSRISNFDTRALVIKSPISSLRACKDGVLDTGDLMTETDTSYILYFMVAAPMLL